MTTEQPIDASQAAIDYESSSSLKAPFPYFGGKSKIASLVWERFGRVNNYVEPFGGSLAVLLARPVEHEWWKLKETAGDYSGLVVNFYRAVQRDPDAVTREASWPVTEADLTSRHLWLVRRDDGLSLQLAADPDYYDVRAAGWWVWGISSWVGGEWCSGLGPWHPGDSTGPGVYRKMPMVAGNHGGKGIHKPLKDAPEFGADGPDVEGLYRGNMQRVFTTLSNRLYRVRLVYGDWSRLTRSAVTPAGKDTVGVFLDPPYDPSLRRGDLYGPSDRNSSGDAGEAEVDPGVHEQAREWALDAGGRKNHRIAYCGYSTDEEDSLFSSAGWSPVRWTASGGYGLQSDRLARENRSREIVWFSPECLPPASSTIDPGGSSVT